MPRPSVLNLILILSLALTGDAAAARKSRAKNSAPPPPPAPEQACPNPVHPDWPSVAFTVRAWDSSGLDRCEERIRIAQEMGFTAIQFAINYSYDSKRRTVEPLPGMIPLFKKCMKVAASRGLDVQYAPHFSDLSCVPDPTFNGANCWRAWRDVWPDLDKKFIGNAIDPFREFLRENPTAFDRSKPGPKAELLLASELEKSLTWHPKEWTRVIQTLKAAPEIARANVSVGIAPNHHPHCWTENCEDMLKLYQVSDFISPSLYGNFATETTASRIDRLSEQQSKRGHCSNKKQITQLVQSKLGIGEYGFGGSFSLAEDFTPETFIKQIQNGSSYRSYSQYQQRRRNNFEDLFKKLRTGSMGPHRIAGMWTADIHDFTGLSGDLATDPQGNLFQASTVQPDLINLLRSYSQERCGKFSTLKSTPEIVMEAEAIAHQNQQKTPKFSEWLGKRLNPNCPSCEYTNPSPDRFTEIKAWTEHVITQLLSDDGADVAFCRD